MGTKKTLIHARVIRLANNVNKPSEIEYPDNWSIIGVVENKSGLYLTVYFVES